LVLPKLASSVLTRSRSTPSVVVHDDGPLLLEVVTSTVEVVVTFLAVTLSTRPGRMSQRTMEGR
jgi:hypothetical protein